MHQRTGEQQQKWQRAEQMCTVFAEQEEGSDRQKHQKYPIVTPWETTVPGGLVMFHHALLFKKIHVINRLTSSHGST
jgi:hypothetical protein